jgi:oxygen-independent coproporphyrinogen-3 oxidase
LDITLADIDTAIAFDVNHLSLYPLRIEPNSVFYDRPSKFADAFIDENSQVAIYSQAAEYLRSRGYEHYSIFHFSNQPEATYLDGRNQIYGGEWIGVGVAAYSSYNGFLFANTKDIREYIRHGHEDQWHSRVEQKSDALKRIVWEFIFSLRSTRITHEYYVRKYGRLVYDICLMPIFRYLSQSGYVEDTGSGYRLTEGGIVNLPYIEHDVLANYEKIMTGT